MEYCELRKSVDAFRKRRIPGEKLGCPWNLDYSKPTVERVIDRVGELQVPEVLGAAAQAWGEGSISPTDFKRATKLPFGINLVSEPYPGAYLSNDGMHIEYWYSQIGVKVDAWTLEVTVDGIFQNIETPPPKLTDLVRKNVIHMKGLKAGLNLERHKTPSPKRSIRLHEKEAGYRFQAAVVDAIELARAHFSFPNRIRRWTTAMIKQIPTELCDLARLKTEEEIIITQRQLQELAYQLMGDDRVSRAWNSLWSNVYQRLPF